MINCCFILLVEIICITWLRNIGQEYVIGDDRNKESLKERDAEAAATEIMLVKLLATR